MRKALMAILLNSAISVAVAIPLLLSHAQNQTIYLEKWKRKNTSWKQLLK